MHDTQSASTTTGDYPVVYRNLMAVGLLGAIYRCADDAHIVNEAVELTLADPSLYRLYRSIALGMGGNSAYAKKTLTAQVEQNPDDDTSKVALAVSLMFSGDSEWQHWLNNVLATSSDQKAREAANGVLSYLSTLGRAH